MQSELTHTATGFCYHDNTYLVLRAHNQPLSRFGAKGSHLGTVDVFKKGAPKPSSKADETPIFWSAFMPSPHESSMFRGAPGGPRGVPLRGQCHAIHCHTGGLKPGLGRSGGILDQRAYLPGYEVRCCHEKVNPPVKSRENKPKLLLVM